MASSKAMFMEDADEDGTVKPHTKKTAKSVAAPSRAGSPVKQEPNTGRKKSSSQRTHATATTSPHDSDATEHASSSSRHKNREKRSSRKGKEVPERPRITTAQTTPSMRNHYAEDSAHYSVPHRAIAVSSGRPRANSRPQSYIAPPLSQSAFFQASPLSYGPPPQWGGPPPLGSSPLGTSPMAYPVDYFTGRADYDTGGADRLASRFEARPRSSMGNYGSSYEDRYTDFDAPSPHSRPSTVIRKPSLSKRTTKNNEDRRQMPPPPRPSTVGPRQHFRPPPPPPPPPSQRKSVGFDDVSSDGESDLFRDAPHGVAIDFMKAFPIRNRRQSTTRRQSLGGEYPGEGYAIEPAGPKTRRPNRRSVSYSVEDKMNDANRYQNAVASAIPAPLTPDNLRRVKNSTSSRSTRSSGSRDESSFRQSETTKTTRSGSNDDDMTIKVPSGTVVEYGGAKINCVKGGEMTFGRGGGGSDRGTIYGDELRSHAHRTERSGTRPRASSQSAHARRPRAIMSPNPHDHAADYPDNATYFGIPQYATYHGYPYDDDEYDHVYDT